MLLAMCADTGMIIGFLFLLMIAGLVLGVLLLLAFVGIIKLVEALRSRLVGVPLSPEHVP